MLYFQNIPFFVENLSYFVISDVFDLYSNVFSTLLPGKKCEQKIQYCQTDTNFCRNNGKCVDLDHDYRLVSSVLMSQIECLF